MVTRGAGAATSDAADRVPKELGRLGFVEGQNLRVVQDGFEVRHDQLTERATEIIKAARDFFDNQGFTLTDPPILTPAACEGTTTLFPVDYFGDEAYLTQSGQLYSESTALALGKVYSFGPTFRAEKSKTRRHLTEFWMVEPEWAYAGLDDLMGLAEQFISFIVDRVLTRRAIADAVAG